jgi:hypothetical protein
VRSSPATGAVTVAKKQNGAGNAALDSALESFEGDFFDHMVLVLDNYFLPPKPNLRVGGSEPLNEVRMLCISLLSNDGKICSGKSIKYAKSVLKYRSQLG